MAAASPPIAETVRDAALADADPFGLEVGSPAKVETAAAAATDPFGLEVGSSSNAETAIEADNFDPFGTAAASPPITETVSDAPEPLEATPETEFDKLGSEEFLRLFGMDRASFKKLPRWKQVDAKRRASLL